MSLKKDVIGADVQINSNEAQKSLVDLTQKTSELANENDRLRITQAKLKALGKENTEEYKKVTKAISDNSKQIKDNNVQMDALRKTIGVTEMSTKQLSKRALELRRELSGMSQATDPERFNKLNRELIDTERQMRKNKAAIGETKDAVNPLLESAKGLLPAFGWASIAAGATWAFNKIINITDTLGTKWEATTNGMSEGLDEFFRTIATGDWSNFLDRMEEAIRAGRDYINTMDDIEEKTRSLSVIESESRQKELDLEEKLKNKTLSKEERIKAGQERIAIEKDLAEKRTKVAHEAFDNEANITAMQTKLTKDQLMTMLRDMDSETKKRAQEYNAVRDSYKKGGFTEKELNENLVINKDVTDSVKAYATVLRMAGNTTDEQMEKMVASYVKLMEAQNSAKENTKRITTTVNSLLAGEEENGQKLEDKALKAKKDASDKAIEILDTAQNERMAKISAQYVAESQSDAWFQNQQLAAETAYLIQKRAILQQFSQSTVDVDNQINQKRIESQKEFNTAMALVYKELEDAQTQTQKTDDAAIDALIQSTNDALAKSKEIQQKEKQILEQRQDAYLNFAQMVGQSFGDLIADSEATFGDYLKNVLLMSLEALHQFLLIGQAKAWITAATEGAPINPIAVGKAVAKIALMEMAYQAVRGLLTRGKQSGGYSNTDGSDSTPDGVYHKNEFIASAPAVRNPTIRPILNIIDMAQRQGKIAQLNLPAVMASMGAFTSGSRQAGGFADTNTTTAPGSTPSPQFSDASIARWEAIADRFEQMQWNFNFTEFEKIQKRRSIREKQSKL